MCLTTASGQSQDLKDFTGLKEPRAFTGLAQDVMKQTQSNINCNGKLFFFTFFHVNFCIYLNKTQAVIL